MSGNSVGRYLLRMDEERPPARDSTPTRSGNGAGREANSASRPKGGMVAVLAESKTGVVDVEMEQAQCHHFPAGLRPTEHAMSREGVHSAWARCACGKCATACSLSSGPHVTRTWSNTVCRWMPHRYSSPLPPTIRQHVATFRSTMPRLSCKSPAPVAMRRRGHVYPCYLVAAGEVSGYP